MKAIHSSSGCVRASLALLLGTCLPIQAQVIYQRLKSFGYVDQVGINPWSSVTQGSDGFLYGTTYNGGLSGAGTVFKVQTNGAGYAVLHSFSTTGGDGQNPRAALLLGKDGALYGTTEKGGNNSVGTAFRISRDGADYSILHHFSAAGSDGQRPFAALAQDSSGALYGTTYAGGTNGGGGTVFKLGPDGNGFTLLHSFTTTLTGDGQRPYAALIQGSDGAFYGTTYSGGTNSRGTVFRISADGVDYALLRSFSASGGDAQYPQAALLQGSDGALYGTTYNGGTNNAGAIFRITDDGGSYDVLRSFVTNGVDGQQAYSSLVQGMDGFLYGTTQLGGSSNVGTIFRMATNGADYSVLRSFGTSGGDPQQPYAGVILGADGALYGTSRFGGGSASGALFRLDRDGSSYAVLRSFSLSGGDGYYPYATVSRGRDGALYGTTQIGGANNAGSVFRMNPNGSGYTTLRSFSSAGGDGQQPYATVIQGSDGALYGTTQSGGSNNVGTLFKMNPNGSGYTLLRQFSSTGGDGKNPQATLLQLADSTLYGTTYNGGSNNYGTVFKINPDGSGYSILRHFGAGTSDGRNPAAALIRGATGVLYGTTYSGGTGGYGTIFKINPDGSGYSILRSFSTGSDGRNPQAALVQADNGLLCGTTYNGGTASKGILFRINPDTLDYASVRSFGTFTGDGWNPRAPLVQGNDGALYGTTFQGGSASAGTVFQINTDGSDYQVLRSFNADGYDGQKPWSALFQDPSGAFFGTTSTGGDLGLGTLFRLALRPPVVLDQPTNQIALAGTTPTFAVSVTGTPPFEYAWQYSGTNLPGATNASLSLPNVARADAGTYSVWITNAAGFALSSDATLVVNVPQSLGQPEFMPDGSLQIPAAYADGWPLQSGDLVRFEAQASTNLVDWEHLAGALVLTNSHMRLVDPWGATALPRRFYRVVEH